MLCVVVVCLTFLLLKSSWWSAGVTVLLTCVRILHIFWIARAISGGSTVGTKLRAGYWLKP
jgi:hypothetical protein